MAHTLETLRKKSVAELRDVAKDIQHDALSGYTTMHKDHLLRALCTALNIDIHEHHDVVGIDKARMKEKIHELKRRRDEALQAHDHAQLKRVRRDIHRLKRRIHSATV